MESLLAHSFNSLHKSKSLSNPELTMKSGNLGPFSVKHSIKSSVQLLPKSKSVPTVHILSYKAETENTASKEPPTTLRQQLETLKLVEEKTERITGIAKPEIYTHSLDTFKELEHMEQNRIVSDFFNSLAPQCIQYGTDEIAHLTQQLEEFSDDVASFMYVNTAENNGTNIDYYLLTNNCSVLAILHEQRGDHETTDEESLMHDVLGCSENVFLVGVPKDQLVLFTRADIGKKIPHLEEQTKMQVWRSDPSIQTYQDGSRDPDLVLIGLTALRDGFSEEIIGYVIPNDIYCDANKAISQQIINYCNSQKDPYIKVSCPDSDGRGAVYSFNGVPFHSTSSRNYCTMLCDFLGILGEHDTYFYRLGSVPDHTHFAELTPDTHQSRLPIMTHFQKKGHYEHVLMTTLGEYIKASLEFQLSKSEGDPDRFAYPGKAEKPTDETIRSALTDVSELLQSNVRS